MTLQWEKVYIFISSTFNDMHAERDFLVKSVFPELSEWCEERKLRLVDIDLRWGVTEQDATKNKNVVKVCLERIDECRPFFLCFLGQRRGWVPRDADVSDETKQTFPELGEHLGRASITEMEILHALVKPLSRRTAGGPGNAKLPAEHTFFYLREPDYLDQLKEDNPDLLQIFTNKQDGKSVEKAFEQAINDVQLEEWREKTIPSLGRPVRKYTASWDSSVRSPELAPRAAVTGADLTRGRLVDFQLAQEGAPGTHLDQVILEDLKGAIAARYPEHMQIVQESDLQRELDQQEQFLFASSEGFISRGNDFEALDHYARSDSNKVFVLTAPAGMGKSTLLANWIDRYRNESTVSGENSLHFRFIGASDQSSSVDTLLRYLLRELKEIHAKFTADIPADPKELRLNFPNLLASAASRQKMVVVLDAINQLQSGLGDIDWLPWELPQNVKMIISFKSGEEVADDLLRQLRRKNMAVISEVRQFDNLNDRQRLVNSYLDQYLKDLDEQHINALITSPGAQNPLYLKVVLSELRIFGVFEDLGRKIREDFGDTPVDAFQAVLKRLESDPAYTPLNPGDAVPLLFGLMVHARQGLSVEELSAVFLREMALDDNSESRQAAADTIHHYLRQVRPYLAHRDNRNDFFFESFLLAARTRYVSEEVTDGSHQRPSAVWHSMLARYFGDLALHLNGRSEKPNVRKVSELPYHQAHGHLWEELQSTLTDFEFVTAKINAIDPYQLIADYSLARKVGYEETDLPLVQSALQTSAHILNTDPSQLSGQLLARLMTARQPSIQKLLDKARAWDQAPWLRPLFASLSQAGGSLVNTLSGHQNGIRGLLTTSDGKLLASGSDDGIVFVWDLDTGNEVRSWDSEHLHPLTDLFITPDGIVLLTSDGSNTKSWDLASGRKLHTRAGKIHAVTSEGKALITNQGGIIVWDPFRNVDESSLGQELGFVNMLTKIRESGELVVSRYQHERQSCLIETWDLTWGARLWSIPERFGTKLYFKILPQTRRLLAYMSKEKDTDISVVDLDLGEQIHLLKGHKHPISLVEVAPDGSYAISTSESMNDPSFDSMNWLRDNLTTFIVWDMEDYSIVTTWQHKGRPVNNIMVSPDGRHVIYSQAGSLQVRDIHTGEELKSLIIKGDWLDHLLITHQSELLVSGANDGTIRLWDLKADETSEHISHKSRISTVAVSHHGERALSLSEDGELMLWNLSLADTSQKPTSVHQEITSAYLTSNGQHVLVGRRSGAIDLLDFDTNKVIQTYKNGANHATAVAMSPDKRSILAIIRGQHGSTLYVWDTLTCKIKHSWQGSYQWLDNIAFTPDGRYVISGQWNVPTVWDLDKGRSVSKLSGDGMGVDDIIVTPDGKSVVLASRGIYESRPLNGVIRLYDIESGKITNTLGAHVSEVSAVVITPDGRRAISTSPSTERDKGEIRIWDLHDGSELNAPKIARSNVAHLCLSLDGRRLITGSIMGDDAIEVWDITDGSRIASFTGEGAFTACSLASDQKTIVAGDISGSFHALVLENYAPGPPIVTAFRPPEKRGLGFVRKTVPRETAFLCPNCLTWIEIDETGVGKVQSCHRCNQTIQLNPFTASVDWQPDISIADIQGTRG